MIKKSEKEGDELEKHLETAINVLYYFYEQIKNTKNVNTGNSGGSGSTSGLTTNKPLKQKKTGGGKPS